MLTTERPTFNPAAFFETKDSDRFQLTYLDIRGELGRAARNAQATSGLTRTKFVEACIMYALGHAPKETR